MNSSGTFVFHIPAKFTRLKENVFHIMQLVAQSKKNSLARLY